MPKEKAIDKLSDAHVVALANFIESEGRNWRNALDYAWIEGRYPTGADTTALQQIRNQHGPSFVAKLKTKDIQTAANAVLDARIDSILVDKK